MAKKIIFAAGIAVLGSLIFVCKMVSKYQNNNEKYEQKEEKQMIVNILCFVGGAWFGLVITCVLVAAGRDDERMGIK